MAEIIWTEEALRWLEDIFEYIALENPRAAAETVDGIYSRSQQLADYPEMGARYSASTRHIRILLYGHYRMANLVKSDRNIDILGVFHGAIDISKYQP